MVVDQGVGVRSVCSTRRRSERAKVARGQALYCFLRKFQEMSKMPWSMLPSARYENRPVVMSSEPSAQPGHRSATTATAVLPFALLVMRRPWPQLPPLFW